MANLLDEVQRLFHTDNLYTLLGCDKDSTQAEIKRAFYKCSLKYHPDRHHEKDKGLATEQFQVVVKAFSILSDKDYRATYDETGIIGESFSEKSFQDWVDYFNLIFPRFTEKDIEEHKKKYIGSTEEKNDIAKYYERYKGDMDKIMESVPFADVFNEDHYRQVIQEMITDNTIKPYDAFLKESMKKRANRLRKAKREAAEFEHQEKKRKVTEKNGSSMDSLILAIQANEEQRMKNADNLIDRLTSKYCLSQKKTGKSKRGKK